jgi:phenylalanyl-tRNA synthetase alpha subunit
MVSLDSVVELPSSDPSQATIVEKHEMQQTVLQTIRSLPDHERTVSTLFYINGYTQKDIAEFLEVPVTTVNNRLHSARARLKKRMVQMVNNEMKSHTLGNEFPARIKQLLALPHPLTIANHPVSQMAEAFRQCFPDFEEVELDEVYDRRESMLEPSVTKKNVYSIDDRRILRPELTPQIIDLWLKSGGGVCKRMTVGRVFRAETENERRLEVHHQAEMLWVDERLDVARLHDTVQRVAAELLPGIEVKVGPPADYPLVSEAWNYVAKWRESWIGIAGGGIAKDEWLIKAGLDPSRYGAIGLAFGLERCAQVILDLDDIRALWRPPFVP